MPRIPAVALSLVLALVLAIAGLSGCALFDDIGGSDLDDAMELVPGDAESIRFIQRQAMAERLGIDDIEHGASKKETRRYVKTLLDEGASHGATDFAPYLDAMATEAAFSELDIVWAVNAYAGGAISESLPRAYKMRDDLDLDAVGDDLVDVGYEEDEIAGHRHLFIADAATGTEFDGMVGAYPGVQMLNVVVVPDEHLMFVGGTPETVELAVDVFEDDEDSATDAGTFDEVLDPPDDLEYAELVHHPMCPQSGESGAPQAAAFFVSGDDGERTRVLEFADGSVETEDYSGDEFSAC